LGLVTAKIFLPCLAFHVQVAGDVNKTISFVVGVLQSRRHGGAFGVLTHQTNFKPSQIELWSTRNRWSFYQISECQAPWTNV